MESSIPPSIASFLASTSSPDMPIVASPLPSVPRHALPLRDDADRERDAYYREKWKRIAEWKAWKWHKAHPNPTEGQLRMRRIAATQAKANALARRDAIRQHRAGWIVAEEARDEHGVTGED